MTELHDNRWLAGDHEFATRVEISDVSGFFKKNLTIEPGTRAVILERGQSIGEVTPGQYTLQNLTDRLSFWTKKSIVAILTREGEVPLDLSCSGLATREILEVDVDVRLSIQLDDVALFQKNLLASRDSLTLDDLKRIVLPLVQQSLRETISGMSIKDLTGQQARTDLEMCVSQALGIALIRNGLKFTQVQTLSVSHPEYDKQQKRTGTLFLQRLGYEHDQAAADLAVDELLAQIKRQEKTNDLEVLAQQVAADRMEGDLAVRLRRIGIYKQMREAARAGQFDRIHSEAEVEKFMLQADKERLLRADELATFKSTLADQSNDRAAVRAQLLKKLDLEQQAELQAVRVDLEFTHKLRTRQHEIALAELNDSEESRQWKKNLQREIEGAEHRRNEELKQTESDRKRAKEFADDGREDEWQEVLHDQRIDRVKGEIEVSRAERGQRITLISVETHKAEEFSKLEIDHRKAQLEDEIKRLAIGRQSEKIDLLDKLKAMNEAANRAQHELVLAAKQKEAELEALKADRISKAQIDFIVAIKDLNDSALIIAAPDAERAAILAGVVNTKAVQATQAEIAKAQLAEANNAKIAESLAQMTDYERQRNSQQTELLTRLLQQKDESHSANVGQIASLVESITKSLAHQAPPPPPAPTVIVGGQQVSPAPQSSPAEAPRRTVVCSRCRAENRETDRFCCQCGNPM